jgi:phosphatidate cytidylyltransferase
MLPVAIGAVWLGGWAFAISVGCVAGLMYWEWQGLCTPREGRGHSASWYAGIAGCSAGPIVAAAAGGPAAIMAGLGVTGLTGLLLAIERRPHGLFLLAGLPYILFACSAMVWLREIPNFGLVTVIWLLIVVVVTDTAAYFTGRTLGGPKLAPKISPKKTWSGLFGGMSGAAIASSVVAANVDGANILTLGLIGGAFAVAAQLGDLLVSKAKRAFGVKDSSNLIPGHGGVLDRLDGFLSASLVLAALALLGGGSPLTWL